MQLNTATASERLKSGAAAFLQTADHFPSIAAAIAEYRSLLYAASGLDAETDESRGHLFFENGKAIGSFWAAKCLDEPLRTKRFVCGLYKAVLDCQKKNPGRAVNVLYAGTGPFATLMLPVVATLKPEEVQFSLLEINPLTFGLLQQTIDSLGLGEYISSMKNCDATTYVIPENELPDIIVSETMQHALTREMQVPLIFNLAMQAPEALLIPEQIRLELGWMDTGKHIRSLNSQSAEELNYTSLGDFFLLDRDAVNAFGESFSQSRNRFSFPEKILELQTENPQEDLTIFTHIHVYADEYLRLNNCSLTIPYRVSRLMRTVPRKGKIAAGYQISDVPGPVINVISEGK